MPAFLVLDSISLATPDGRPLFDGLTLAIGRERTGLVGRNGCGKSTLLRLIAGEIEPASGSLQCIGSIGMLAQLTDERLTVDAALGVAGCLARLRRLERGEGSLDDATEADWTLEARIQAALVEAGLPSLSLHRPIVSLSGGERTRVALARLLIEAPDLLLLDEPTNNLDTDGRQAVAQLLERWQGGVLVASHDRALLERVDRIVELTPIGISLLGGAWSAFAEAREAARARAADELDRASDALRNTERALQKAREKKARRDKAGRAWRTKGIEDKMYMDREKERAENSAARIAVLDQHIGLLDPGSSILDNLRRLNPELSANEAHAALARFAFRNRAALQITATLSGGERLRAGLACVFARPQPPFLLLLDEPTNHLDLASIEELEGALKGFDGALIAVSHDTAFLQAIGIEREIVLG